MKPLKIIGLFVVLFSIAMLILAFYNLIEDEEKLVVLASFCIMLFIAAIYMAIGLAMMLCKKKEREQ